MKVSYPYLVKRRQVFFARLVVPADLKNVIRRGTLIKTTGESHPAAALKKAMPMIAEWQARFAEIRAGRDKTGDEVSRLSGVYKRLKREDPRSRWRICVG